MNYKFIGKSVWLEEEKILVIADLHLGYEESLNIAMPRLQYNEIIGALEDIFKCLKKEKKEVEKIIVLGDLKHEFSRNIGQEWNEVRKIFSFLAGKLKDGGKMILIKGNHDKFIETIASKYDVETRDYYIENDKAFVHGDKQFIEILDNEIKYLFMGHIHPAIRLEEGAKREIYKCFLVGGWKDKKIIVLPSFFPLIEGVDVVKESFEKSYLAYKFNLKEFKVYIPAENCVLDFGKLKDVERLE